MNEKRPFIVGLTGGIGSGKTAATLHFQALGVHVVDADLVAREVVAPGTPALQAIADHFGAAILTPEGQLDRAALRLRVFADSAERIWLEQLLHPLIRRRIREQLAAATSAYSILVSPLLLETDQKNLVDRILLVDLPEALQLERAMARDSNTREQIEAIMRTQSERTFKLKHADDIILNDQDLPHLHRQVEQLHRRYLQLALQAEQKQQAEQNRKPT